MFLSKAREQLGSAILEFVIFVILGQLLVFGGSIALSTLLTSKVELQILAANATRSIALKVDPELPAGVQMVRDACSPPLVCVTLQQGSTSVSAVGFQ